VYADVPDGNKPRWNSEIFVAAVDGSNVRRLTKGETQNNSPSWTPDGKRIIFASDRSGQSQIYSMRADGANVEQLTHEPKGAENPKLSRGGRLAYLALRERQVKVWFQDLIVRDGTTSKTIARHALIYADYAWSPDGSEIAYGKVGGLVFHNLATGKEREVNFAKDIVPEMDSFAAFNLTWRPDGQAVACSIVFFGGREAHGPKMIGDKEIFIIRREGRSSWFAVPVEDYLPALSLRWVAKPDNNR
jgi:TolB protein